MTWTPITPLLQRHLRHRGLAASVGIASLIEDFNRAAHASFNDPEGKCVRAVSYRRGELTVYCRSPVYAAAVRERRGPLLDAIRKVHPGFPVSLVRFIFKKPDPSDIPS